MPEQAQTPASLAAAAIEPQTSPTQDSLSSILDSTKREFAGGPGATTDSTPAVETKEGPVGHPAVDAPLDPQMDLPLHQQESPVVAPETPVIEPEWQPKYKDQRAAEDAEAEAQRKITEQSLKLSETNELLLKELARKTPEPATAQPAVASADAAIDFVKDRRRKAIDKIESLNPDTDDYKDLVAAAQADADKDVQNHYREQDRLDFETRQGEIDVANNTQAAIGKALTGSGLESSVTSVDYMLFNHFANDYTVAGDKLVDRDGSILTQPQAIEKTIEKVIKHNQSALEKYKLEQARKQAEIKQGGNDQPLERGAGGPETIMPQSPPLPVKPVTLGSLLDSAQQARVI